MGVTFLRTQYNKKFELMLMERAKAYSSSYPHTVTHRSTNRTRRRVTSFQPKRVTNYGTPPRLVVAVGVVVAVEYVSFMLKTNN